MFKLALIVCFATVMTAFASPAQVGEGDSIPARIARSPYQPYSSDNHESTNSGNNDGSGNLATGGDGNTYNNYQGSSLPRDQVYLSPRHR